MATVLIVEDEDTLRDTLSRYLVHEGHEVIAAASGQEALDAGIDAEPDVLIADWMLKNHIHGLHVSEVIRAVHPGINTILITGFPSRDLLEESDRCGVSSLLEKPFDLKDLHDAVDGALSAGPQAGDLGPPIAALAIGEHGELLYASQQATELFGTAGLSEADSHLNFLIEGDAETQLREAEHGWIEVVPLSGQGLPWLMRTRKRILHPGWLVVLCPREEEQRRTDPRVRILLNMRDGSHTAALEDRGPMVVIERDGVVRRLLVSQIERVGAICYASDDLESAIRLINAEPRAETIFVDFALAGSDMPQWVAQIRAARPTVTIIGTGGVGAESDLLAQGVESVLRKPWRINDLVEAIERR